jgi:hypothetical protein
MRLAGAWHDELDAGERQALEAHLAGCPACRAEAEALTRLWHGLAELPAAEPGPAVAARFHARLAAELERERHAAAPLAFRSRVGRGVVRFAARAATLALGALGGIELARHRDARQLEELRREVASLHESVTLALLAGESSTERLRGVAYGRETSVSDSRVTAALLEALRSDPDVNVRLSALEALRPLAARPEAHPQLVAALTRQDSPLVQLSLLEVLLSTDEPAVRRQLRGLLDHPELDPAVRGWLRDRLGRSI